MPTKADRASEYAPAQLVPGAEGRPQGSGTHSASVSEAGPGLGADPQPCRPVEQAPRTSPTGCGQSTEPSCLAAMTTLDSTTWGPELRSQD